MANKAVTPRPMPRLYLATPLVDDPAPLVASLPGLLAGADVAAVLVRLGDSDPRSQISRVKSLAPAIQNAVVDAVSHLGVRHIDMPATPQRVWTAINAALNSAQSTRRESE